MHIRVQFVSSNIVFMSFIVVSKFYCKGVCEYKIYLTQLLLITLASIQLRMQREVSIE